MQANIPIRLKGCLDEEHWKTPYTKIVIEGKEYEAMIDTGAVFSVIAPKLLSEIGNKLPYEATADTALPGNEEPVSYLRFLIEFRFSEFEYIFREPFADVPHDFNYPIIIGTDFLSKCVGFHYYGLENRFELVIQ